MAGEPGISEGNIAVVDRHVPDQEHVTPANLRTENVFANRNQVLLQEFSEADQQVIVRGNTAADTLGTGVLKEVLGTSRSIETARSDPQLVADLAIGWDKVYKIFERMYGNINQQRARPLVYDQADNTSFRMYQALENLLSGEITDNRMYDPTPLTPDEVAKAYSGGYGVIDTYLQDAQFPAHAELAKMAVFDLELAWRHYNDASRSSYRLPERDSRWKAQYEKKKHLALPLMKDAVRITAVRSDQETLEEIFQKLNNMEDKETATALLLDASLSAEQLVRVAVAHTNAFGFIETVDTVSHALTDTTLGDEEIMIYKQLYNTLQGDELEDIYADLSDIYNKVDFHEYALNSEELTQREGVLLEEYIQETIGRRSDISQDEIRILDLGAGTGRHSIFLREQGYRDVTAFEYEPKHVAKIHEQDPDLRVIQGDWHQLSDELDPLELFDFGYSFGRTLTHNRTPGHMFHTFDEVHQVLDDTGSFAFDQPDVNWGVYRNRIEKMKQNVEALGVRNFKPDIIFDGPDETHKYNRMVLRPEQVDALAALIGFKRGVEVQSIQIENGDINNLYYHFHVDPSFDPSNISRQELGERLATLGLLGPGTNYNMQVKAWGMTLGQALLYGLDNERIRKKNLLGEGPEVTAEFAGGQLLIEATTSRGTLF